MLSLILRLHLETPSRSNGDYKTGYIKLVMGLFLQRSLGTKIVIQVFC